MTNKKRASANKQDLWNEISDQLNLKVDPSWYSSGSNVNAHAFEAALKKISERTGIPPTFLSENEQIVWRMLHKSQEAMLSAIQTINNPTLVYRLESFLFLFINSWELLLKAKILKDSNDITSIFINDSNDKSIPFSYALNYIFSSRHDPIRKNLEIIDSLRNDAAHLIIPIVPAFALVSFQAGIRNFERKIEDWFQLSLSEKFPHGMIFLISNIDSAIFSVESALVSRKIDNGTAQVLSQWQQTFKQSLEGLNDEEVISYAIPLNFNLNIVNNPSKADVFASISPDNISNSLVAIKYRRPIDRWPLSYTKLYRTLKEIFPSFTSKQLNELLNKYKIRGNEIYSGYNFRTKELEDKYLLTGQIPKGTACIYGHKLIEFLIEKIGNDFGLERINNI